jgi:transcriptional regulator with XRE-family HTH domain
MAEVVRDELLTTFGEVVRRARHPLGISQEELADRVGVHRTYMGGIERGQRNVAILNLDRIARALELDLGSLMTQVEGSRRPRR